MENFEEYNSLNSMIDFFQSNCLPSVGGRWNGIELVWRVYGNFIGTQLKLSINNLGVF